MTEESPSQTLIDGKYQLLRLIGRGGMGSVWEGRHASLGTRVAVKFIDVEHANSPEARLRFDNEARAAATLQSKYAIQIHDHGLTSDGRPFIVMELLNGEALDKRLERLGTLSLPETAHIIQQVCKGLQRAHDRGIIHRDLKPENIFIVADEEEGGELVKVLDFGIAKMRADGISIGNNTRTGAILGTPYYMSPEQARGLRDLDHRSDLWSLGVIAFRCLIGRLPFEGESVGDLLVKICTFPLPVPSQSRPDLPPSFDAWFARTLERDPAGRFGSANELAGALCDLAGVPRGSRTSGMDAYHALHRAAISSSEHNTLPANLVATPQGPQPQNRPSYSGPGPISGTPLPSISAASAAASVTSAGLSSSTANYRPRRSGKGLIVALGALFALVGALGSLVIYLAFIRKPPETPGFASSRPESTVEPASSPTTTATTPLALPEPTLPSLQTNSAPPPKPSRLSSTPPPKPSAGGKQPLAHATATASASVRPPPPPVVVPPPHSGHASGI
ncbi:MAG: serine/threonine-protein kinase [Polyangiaceae bacterium]